MTETTTAKSKPTDTLTEFKPVPDDHPEPPHDLSWINVAMDRNGEGWIMDAASGFDACDLLPNGNMCCDNGVAVPSGKPIGLYCLTDVRVGGGELIQSPNGDDYADLEIWSKDWVRLDCLDQAAKIAWMAADALGPADAHTVATGLQNGDGDEAT